MAPRSAGKAASQIPAKLQHRQEDMGIGYCVEFQGLL